MHGGYRAQGTCTSWCVPADPHAPTGPTWAKVPPKCSFTPLVVPIGRVQHRGPGGGRLAEIQELALMSTQRRSTRASKQSPELSAKLSVNREFMAVVTAPYCCSSEADLK